MDEEFELDIVRRIEPGFIEVLDSYQEDEDENYFGTKLAIISLRGDQMFIDNVNP